MQTRWLGTVKWGNWQVLTAYNVLNDLRLGFLEKIDHSVGLKSPLCTNKEGTYNLDRAGDLQYLRRFRQSGPGRYREPGPCRSQALAVTV